MISKLEKEKPNDDSSYFDCCKESAARSRRSGGNSGRASPSAAPKFSERLAHRFSGRRAWHVDRSAALWNRTAPRRFRGRHARRRRAEDRKSTRLNSSHLGKSYDGLWLKEK